MERERNGGGVGASSIAVGEFHDPGVRNVA
jgi:hypothetical protein